jgi:serine/threonine protein phosphatase PrpC
MLLNQVTISPVPMPVFRSAVAWSVASDVGLRRQNNEDAWGAFLLGGGKSRPLEQPRVELGGLGALFILSDGMGGTLAGEEASRFCVEDVAARLAPHSGWRKLSKAMRKAVIETHVALTKRSQERAEWHGMGATLSLVWLLPNRRIVLGHVGDSRVYRLRDGKIEQLTEDHNVGAGMVRRGEMTEEAVTRLKFRALLEQAMGGDGAPISPQVVESEWEPGDAYALCCDGLYGPLGNKTEPAIQKALDDSAVNAADKLIDTANAAGGPDNITVILARLLPEKER